MALKYPRLELRWRKSDESDGDMFPYYNWACDYFLVIARATTGDQRCNTYVKDMTRYGAKPVEYKLNTSYRNSTAEPYPGDIPFRDGTHIQWDATVLNLPAYSKYNGKTKAIKISDNCRKTGLARLNNQDELSRLNKNKKVL